MTPLRTLIAVMAVVGGLLGAGACGDDEPAGGNGAAPSTSGGRIAHDPANGKVAIVIGSKNFTEQKVLGEIYAQALRAAGYSVRTDLNLGDQDAALDAVITGRVDGYPEYTGTALVSFFGVEPGELPHDPRKAYERARAGFAERGLVAFPPTPFTDSNEVAVTKRTATRYRLRKISDLARVARRLTLYGAPECRRRLDCLLGLQRVYGLRFKRFVPVDVSRRHDVLISGRADVSIVFTTDPQIKREGEVLLRDDKGMFPPYNSTLVLRKEIADRAGPDLERTIRLVNSQLTDENMQELNARVDLDGREPADVATAYLRETQMIRR